MVKRVTNTNKNLKKGVLQGCPEFRGIKFVLLAFILIFIYLPDEQNNNENKVLLLNSALGTKSAENEPSNTAKLCDSNPYQSSLKGSLSDIVERANFWLSRLDQHQSRARNEVVMGQWDHERFFPFDAIAACNETTCVGGGCRTETSKIVCGLKQLNRFEKSKCIVYSIGGNNLWQFEKGILSQTPCEVHTFDCTGPRKRFTRIPHHDRMVFHHMCLGNASFEAPYDDQAKCGHYEICGPIRTLEQIQKELSHDRIDLLKMDIEGYEWSILEQWPELSDLRSQSMVLPYQVLIEIHYKTPFKAFEDANHMGLQWKRATDMVDLQAHLLRMGYATSVRNDNRKCQHCTELTLTRFRC